MIENILKELIDASKQQNQFICESLKTTIEKVEAYLNQDPYETHETSCVEDIASNLSDKEAKAERIKRSMTQEQNFVKSCRDPAFRVCDGKDTDCIVFRRDIIEIVDNKFTDDNVFYVHKSDINKGLDIVERLTHRNLPARFAVDMWFPRHQLQRVIQIDESNRDHSLKAWTTEGRRIMTCQI